MRARLLILVGVLAGLTAPGLPAAADSSSTDSDAYVDENETPVVIVGENNDPDPTGGSGSSGDNDCVWKVVIEDDFVFNVYDDEGGPPQHSATGRWLQKLCSGSQVDVNGSFLIPEGGIVDPEALAQQAAASIGIEAPTLRTSPDAEGRLYVRVPTWLWVDGAWWQTYQATASTGRVTATVTAQPVMSTWVMGDGVTVACTGPGVAWQPGTSETATDCSHTYATSSAGATNGAYSLSATVTLEVTWTSNIGAGGTLPTISRTSTRLVDVGEIQAIGTR